MAELEKAPETSKSPDEEFNKADPKLNPRNQSLAEIAAKVALQHVEEEKVDSNVATIDDEGTITQPKDSAPAEAVTEPAGEPAETASTSLPTTPESEPATPAAPAETLKLGEEAIDPKKDYEITVDGQKMKVPGAKIIDAGFRTFQKETAADFRLNVATELMQEAERRMATAPKEGEKLSATPTGEPSNEDLAKALQFGEGDAAAKAIATLRTRGLDDQKIAQLTAQQARTAARDELQFQKALDFVKTEYSDLLANDHLKRFFFMEENRYRASRDKGGLGDARPYSEVYKDIGESMRKTFNLPKAQTSVAPTATAAGRNEVKAKIAPVPKTAAGRLSEQTATKAKTSSEIIAGMAAARGKTRLTPAQKDS